MLTDGSGATVPYVGRFAPTPSGPLHLGSLVAAMASWLDARTASGTWFVRIEDLDEPRNVAGCAEVMVATLTAFGLVPDRPVLWQSRRKSLYADALSKLDAAGLTFDCACTRREIADSRLPGTRSALVYPGTCRERRSGASPSGACRLRVPADPISFVDRAFGQQSQHLASEVGDFVLRRADGIVTYQLAVVVDDAAQGVTHIVRGADLIDSTPRQIYLQRCLGYPTPQYLHVPVVTTQGGEKLSKQTGAAAIDAKDALATLTRAARHLRLGAIKASNIDKFWRAALERYAELEPARLLEAQS